MKKSKKRVFPGFTIVELLVVISIIGLMSVLALVAINKARIKARDMKRRADIKQIQTALELYYDKQNGQYPSETTCDSSRGSCGTACPCSGSDWEYTTAAYIGLSLRNAGVMQNLPKDPKNDNTNYYSYEPCCNAICSGVEPNGTCVGKGCCKFTISATLESGGTVIRLYNR